MRRDKKCTSMEWEHLEPDLMSWSMNIGAKTRANLVAERACWSIGRSIANGKFHQLRVT